MDVGTIYCEYVLCVVGEDTICCGLLLHTVGVVTVYCGYTVGVDTICSAVPSNLSVKVASVLVL